MTPILSNSTWLEVFGLTLNTQADLRPVRHWTGENKEKRDFGKKKADCSIK